MKFLNTFISIARFIQEKKKKTDLNDKNYSINFKEQEIGYTRCFSFKWNTIKGIQMNIEVP
jgi:hypothetical protein